MGYDRSEEEAVIAATADERRDRRENIDIDDAEGVMKLASSSLMVLSPVAAERMTDDAVNAGRR